MTNLYHFLNVMENIPVSGKILLNQEASFEEININQFKGVISVFKNIEIKQDQEQKIWFIDTTKIFQEKNLRIFYMPLSGLEKIIKTKSFTKIPDPKFYMVGVTQTKPALEKIHKTMSESFNKQHFKISNPKLKNYDLKPDFKEKLTKSFKVESRSPASRVIASEKRKYTNFVKKTHEKIQDARNAKNIVFL